MGFLRSLSSCTGLVYALFTVDMFALCNIQGSSFSPCDQMFRCHLYSGIIVLRVWYLYTNRRIGRIIIVACYVASVGIDFGLLAMEWKELEPFYIPGLGCAAPRAPHIWRLFIQHLILHTILYIATTIPAVQMWHQKKGSPVMARLMRE